ncbi:hypothetical protein L1887_31673 [Cichorium endivia]|nr:hypothetical protein L1887_31673 [Cichorium endivia]
MSSLMSKSKDYTEIVKGKMVLKEEEYTETTGQTSYSQSIIFNTENYEASSSRKRKKRKAKNKKLSTGVILNPHDDISQNTSSIEGLQQMDTIIAKSLYEKLTIGSMEILIDYVNQNGVQIMRTRVSKSRKKLLILDVNGLLADIINPPPKDCKSDKSISRRAIFKRPFLDDFLRFCFERFDVGIWSSRTRKILEPVVDYLLGDLKKKLLFLWDLSHCTNSSARSLENRHKFIVFKEIKKIWEKIEYYYDESNTLLLDDSPYKALLNPKHSGIFPLSYSYMDTNDNSLGPEGDLRVYLEGVGTTENVKMYVKQHPFGQNDIDEKSPHWAFYSRVLKDVS